MKAKIARRRLRRYAWQMAKARVFATTCSYKGLGKQWKEWVRVAIAG